MALLSLRNRGGLRPWITPWDVPEEFSRMFEELGSGFALEQERFSPPMDVQETDEAYIVEADIPGIKKEDVKIEVRDDVLTISGDRKSEHEEKREDYDRVERQFGSFRRTLSIPGGFSHEGVEAKFEDGVLRITLPKPEEAKPRRIEVKAR